MRYSFFEIENFKGIQKARLALNPASNEVVTMVGLNESGKTTILEAISQFGYGANEFSSLIQGEDDDLEDADYEKLIPVARRANFNDRVIVRAGVELNDEDVKVVERLLQKRNFRKVTMNRHITIEDAYIFSNSRYDRRHVTWSLNLKAQRGSQRSAVAVSGTDWQAAAKALIPRMMPIRYFPNTLFEFPERIYLEPENDSVKEIFYRDLLDSILGSLNIGANVQEHLIDRSRSSDIRDRSSLDSLLLAIGRGVTETVFGAWSEVFRRKISGKSVAVDLNLDEADREYIRFRIQDEDGYFTIGERSLGFRWFFVYLLLTSYTSAQSQQVLFMFDEPASNLHPTAQQELLRGLGRLATKHRVIYTTHSHHLVNPDWLESALVVRNVATDAAMEDYSAAKTDIKLERYRAFAGQHPDQAYYFQPVLDVLDYNPARLDLISSVVMVEGKNDFYTLRLMQRITEAQQDLNLLPGGGAGSLDTVIRLYLAWARPFIVLLDSDGEGQKQARRYKEMFGPVIEPRLFTLADVNSEWANFTMENLFTSDSTLTIQRRIDEGAAKYNKKLFNRAIQELSAGSANASLDALTEERFTELLGFLATSMTNANADAAL